MSASIEFFSNFVRFHYPAQPPISPDFLAFLSSISANVIWNQLCSCMCSSPGRGAHGDELSGVETCGSDDDEQRHERAAASVVITRNQSDARGGHESEERAASGPGHSRPASQHHSQHRRAAHADGDIEVVAAEGPPGGKADATFRLGEGSPAASCRAASRSSCRECRASRCSCGARPNVRSSRARKSAMCASRFC